MCSYRSSTRQAHCVNIRLSKIAEKFIKLNNNQQHSNVMKSVNANSNLRAMIEPLVDVATAQFIFSSHSVTHNFLSKKFARADWNIFNFKAPRTPRNQEFNNIMCYVSCECTWSISETMRSEVSLKKEETALGGITAAWVTICELQLLTSLRSIEKLSMSWFEGNGHDGNE